MLAYFPISQEYIIRQRTSNVDVDSKGHPCKERMLSVLCDMAMADHIVRCVVLLKIKCLVTDVLIHRPVTKLWLKTCSPTWGYRTELISTTVLVVLGTSFAFFYYYAYLQDAERIYNYVYFTHFFNSSSQFTITFWKPFMFWWLIVKPDATSYATRLGIPYSLFLHQVSLLLL